MAIITVRLSEEEKQLIESYAELNKESVSLVIKKTVFEKIENELDINMLQDYELEKDSEVFKTFDETLKELGLNEKI